MGKIKGVVVLLNFLHQPVKKYKNENCNYFSDMGSGPGSIGLL
jgi:hypothetical protein